MKNKTSNNEQESPNKLKKVLKAINKGINVLLFPSKIKCVICGDDLPQKQEIEICENCTNLVPFINEKHCCQKCGEPITGQGHYCLSCMNNKRKFDVARSVASFEGVVQQLIHGFKFGGKPYLSLTMGNLMAQKLVELGWDFDLITPVPVSKSRLKERGYNQALLLCNQIATHFNKPVVEVLEKVKQTQDQVGLNFKERQENLEGSIAVCNKEEVANKAVLLVDDVFTTGATANVCAQALFKTGAKSVLIITFAHSIVKLNTEIIDETEQKNKK